MSKSIDDVILEHTQVANKISDLIMKSRFCDGEELEKINLEKAKLYRKLEELREKRFLLIGK